MFLKILKSNKLLQKVVYISNIEYYSCAVLFVTEGNFMSDQKQLTDRELLELLVTKTITIEQDLAHLKQGQSRLEQDVAQLKQG